MERGDLDAIERRAESAKPSELFVDLIALVAELRVAREVVGQVHSYAAAMRRDDGAGDVAEEWHRLGTALVAYDQEVT